MVSCYDAARHIETRGFGNGHGQPQKDECDRDRRNEGYDRRLPHPTYRLVCDADAHRQHLSADLHHDRHHGDGLLRRGQRHLRHRCGFCPLQPAAESHHQHEQRLCDHRHAGVWRTRRHAHAPRRRRHARAQREHDGHRHPRLAPLYGAAPYLYEHPGRDLRPVLHLHDDPLRRALHHRVLQHVRRCAPSGRQQQDAALHPHRVEHREHRARPLPYHRARARASWARRSAP